MAPRLLDWRERASYEHEQHINNGHHRRAARQGIRLVVTSEAGAASLRRLGIETMVVPFGYHPSFAGPVQDVDDSRRDIDVLLFGAELNDTRTRRTRVVERVLGELDPSVRALVVVGDVWGIDRQRLLGRARVVLNVNRVPGNSIAIRALLVGAAGAVTVSDPVGSPAPFVPGVHYIESPVDDLPAAIESILADRPRRLEMARITQRFVVDERTMAHALGAVLDAAVTRDRRARV